MKVSEGLSWIEFPDNLAEFADKLGRVLGKLDKLLYKLGRKSIVVFLHTQPAPCRLLPTFSTPFSHQVSKFHPSKVLSTSCRPIETQHTLSPEVVPQVARKQFLSTSSS